MRSQRLSRFTRKFTVALWLMACITTSAQSAPEAWVRRYGSLVNSNDRATKVVIDHGGNALVAAVTDDGMNGNHLLIIKYSGTGLPLWTNRLGSVSPGDMALDKNGDVFVAATPLDGTSQHATLKVSNVGVPLWTNRYDGPDNSYDAIAVDAGGNVIVTRSSGDYVTVKYSGAGLPLWTNRYHGPAYGNDEANAVAVDASGNVFVTGASQSGGGYSDYATVAYSSAGVPLWTNRYNGPGNSYDKANALAVDGSGNVFVTGTAGVGLGDYDYVTIKYSNSGLPLWTNLYSGPGNAEDTATALAVDGNGNIVVTGYLDSGGGNYDYATVAYSSVGVELWANRYAGPGNGYDHPNALAMDGSGNVFVTGHSDGGGGNYDYATVAYSSAGVPLWTNRYNGLANGADLAMAIAVDGSGNVVVTGSSRESGYDESDCTTIKYSAAGVPLWTNRYNGLKGADDGATAIAVDGFGDVIVTGNAIGNNGQPDYATVKYSSAGVPLWTNRYDRPDNGESRARALAVDSNGNVFVAGSAGTVAYSGGGVPLWTNNLEPATRAIAVDSNGNVLVTMQDDFDSHTKTIKYSGAGVPLWTNRYIGPGNQDDPVAIAVDASLNVVVTGVSYDSNGYGDYATIKYSVAGAPLWTNRYNGPAHQHDEPYALGVDGAGNVFVTGRSWNGSYYEFATVKYASTGGQLWTRRYSGPAFNPGGEGYKLAVDKSGSVVVTGISGYPGFVTIKYSGTGVPAWTNALGLSGNAGLPAIAVDGNGNVIVTGTTTDGSIPSNYPYDYLTVAYSSAGVPLWTNRYDGPGHNGDYARGMALDSSGNVFVTGASEGDYVTIKYSIAALLPIPLNYQVVGNQLVLSWTNTAFSLQSAPAAQGTYTNISGGTSPYTSAFSNPQRYFRLKGN